MATNPDFRTGSPGGSSGRASPANHPRLRYKEDVKSKVEKGTRRWANAIERVLATYEQGVTEWADFIAFLSRLSKVIQAKPSHIEEIPHKFDIAKRLAQCLGPGLPSGVHQKAIEVYELIFSMIGETGLSRDLSLYLPGLAPLISFASLSVKPLILGLYEQHIVRIDPNSLRGALKALILSLLPALEEENAEEFEKAFKLLETLKIASRKLDVQGDQQEIIERDRFFWQCVFLTSVTSPSRRLGALAYLSRKLPCVNISSSTKTADLNSIAEVMNPEPGLLIRCFCTGLQDENALVQRGFLDLLCDKLPLSSSAIQEKAEPADRSRLVLSAASVVLRKDMSLNRRLWTWLLGPTAQEEKMALQTPTSPTPNEKIAYNMLDAVDGYPNKLKYFRNYGLDIIVDGLKYQMTLKSQDTTDVVKTLRICHALMDKWEIGTLVVPHIFVPALESVLLSQSSGFSKVARNEVLRSGSMFFDSVESSVIWGEAVKMIRAVFQNSNAVIRQENLKMLSFIVNNFDLRDDDMQKIHLPLISLYSVLHMYELFHSDHPLSVLREMLQGESLRMVLNMLQLNPNRPTALEVSGVSFISPGISNDPLILSIEGRYLKEDAVIESFPSEDMVEPMLSQLICYIMADVLRIDANLQSDTVEAAVMMFDVVFKKFPTVSTDAPKIVLEAMKPTTCDEEGYDSTFSIAQVLTRTSLLEIMSAAGRYRMLLRQDLLRGLIPRLVSAAWHSLTLSAPQHHVEASKALWRLHTICGGNDLVESSIVSLGVELLENNKEPDQGLMYAQCFTIFWQHSQSQSDSTYAKRHLTPARNSQSIDRLHLLARPLFQIIDKLLGMEDEVSAYVEHWLESTSDLTTVLNVVLAHTLNATAHLASGQNEETKIAEDHSDAKSLDIESCIYFMRLIIKIVDLERFKMEAAMGETSDSNNVQQFWTKIEMLIVNSVSIVTSRHKGMYEAPQSALIIRKIALELIEKTLSYLPLSVLSRLKVDVALLDELWISIERKDWLIQPYISRVIAKTLELRSLPPHTFEGIDNGDKATEKRVTNDRSSLASNQFGSMTADYSSAVPSKVLDCIVAAFSQGLSNSAVACWCSFLQRILPLYRDAIFQVLIPLNECLCNALASMLKTLRSSFGYEKVMTTTVNDNTIIQVLGSLERSLEIAHGTLAELMVQSSDVKTMSSNASFFSMVSPISSDGGRTRSSIDNNKLTVLLCFKDALRICFELWSLDESSITGLIEDSTRLASFRYIALRLRNRTRRIVEHLLQAQILECIEAFVCLWHDSMLNDDQVVCGKILGLLSTIDSARPKTTVPALFNAIYSRTHPSALDAHKRSSLTSDISEVSLAEFLIVYVRYLEDDATDEIWQICVTFLNDVLASPLNHRQILVQLLYFVVELGAKIDKTNFGEQRKMRRELGDLFIRLLSAVTTIRPAGMNHAQVDLGPENTFKSSLEEYKQITEHGSASLVLTLSAIFPRLSPTILDHDRLTSVASQVSTQVLSPMLKSKSFPDNITVACLGLLMAIGVLPEASRVFKKDVADCFSDLRFFSIDISLSRIWLSILRQWIIGDNEKLTELYSRLPSPTVAGLVFGVGASSARIEADRKTQHSLRRIATLLVAAPQDAFVINLTGLAGKVTELLHADTLSSPSSVTRSEMYMLFRALLLRFSSTHLSQFLPMLTSEISDALSSMFLDSGHKFLMPDGQLQLCKLIETMLILNYDEFQLQEWLFITDTTDAIYRPSHIQTTALTDLLAEDLDKETNDRAADDSLNLLAGAQAKPSLTRLFTDSIPEEQYTRKIFKPFFRQLSINFFEGTYKLQKPDFQSCLDELVADLFNFSALA